MANDPKDPALPSFAPDQPPPPEKQWFQVGVEVIKECSTDIRVKVQAYTLEEAQDLARKAVRDRCETASDDNDLSDTATPGQRDWWTEVYTEAGISTDQDNSNIDDYDPDLVIDGTGEPTK